MNSGVVIYLLWSGVLFSTAVSAVRVAMLVILGILFLTSFVLALIAVVVANMGILFLNSFILALRAVLVAKLLIWGILSSIFIILALHTSFLTTSFFTTSLSLLNSTGTGTNSSTLDFPIS